MKNEYARIKRIIDDYFRLVRKLMTGQGDVPDYVLKRLKQQGKKIEGLIPRMARRGAALFPDGDQKAAAEDLKRQVEAAQIRVDLAMDNLKTKTLQTAQDALTASIGVAAGAALFGMAAQALRRRRSEYSADWARTVKTEMHAAKEQGASSALWAYPDGDQTRVFKLCQPDACQRCIEAYQNPDGSPRVFTVGELRRNGTNTGRKAADWLPVIGCMHPHCQCTLHLLP